MATNPTPKTPSSTLTAEEVAGMVKGHLLRAGWAPIRQHQGNAGQAGITLPVWVAWAEGRPPLAIWCKTDEGAAAAKHDSGLGEGQQPWADRMAAGGATVLVVTPGSFDEFLEAIQ